MAKKITSIKVYVPDTYTVAGGDEIQVGGSNELFQWLSKTVVITRPLGRPSILKTSVIRGSEWNTGMLLGYRVRLLVEFDDATKEMFRVRDPNTPSDGSADTQIEAWNIQSDLQELYLRRVQVPGATVTFRHPITNRTVTDVLTNVIFDADFGMPSFFNLGSISADIASTLVSAEANVTTFMELMNQVSEDVKQNTTNTMEMEAVYNTSTNQLDFNFYQEAGAASVERSPYAPMPGARPIRGDGPEGLMSSRINTNISEAQDDFYSRVIPFSGNEEERVGIGGIQWPGTYDNGTNKFTFTDSDAVPFDDMFVSDIATGETFFLDFNTDELDDVADTHDVKYKITDADADAGTITIAATSDPPATVSWCRIYTTLGSGLTGALPGSFATFIHDPAAEDAKGVVEKHIDYSDLPPYDNVFETLVSGSPDMSSWSAPATTVKGMSSMPDGTLGYAPDDSYQPRVIQATASSLTIIVAGNFSTAANPDQMTLAAAWNGWNSTYTISGTPTYDILAHETTIIFTASNDGLETDVAYDGERVDRPFEFDGNHVTASEATSEKYVAQGTKSLKMDIDFAGVGVRTDLFAVTRTAANPYLSVWSAARVESGSVRMQVVDADANIFPPLLGSDQAQSSGDELYGIKIEGILPLEEIDVPRDHYVLFTALEAGTIFYLDSLSVTPSPTAWDFQPLMGTKALYKAAAKELLREGGLQQFQYDTEFYDVTALVPALTNMLIYSEEFDNAAWVQYNGISVTANYAIAPDGATTAERILFSVSTNESVVQEIAVVSGETYHLSLYVKLNTGSVSGVVNLKSFGAATGSINITPLLTTSWRRFNVSILAGSTGTASIQFVAVSNVTADISIWGAQFTNTDDGVAYVHTTSLATGFLPVEAGSWVHLQDMWDGSAFTVDVETRVVEIQEEYDLINGNYVKTGKLSRERPNIADRISFFRLRRVKLIKAPPHPGGDIDPAGSINIVDWVLSANMYKENGGRSVGRNQAGTDGWTEQAYSAESYANGCYLTFKPAQTDTGQMMGLDQNPSQDAGFTNIDYCFYVWEDGSTLSIYESGTQVWTGTYALSSILTIQYDGENVQYLKDGVIQREVNAGAGLTFFVDSSFYRTVAVYDGGQLNNIFFGPMGGVGGDGRPGLPGASVITIYDLLQDGLVPNANGEYALLSVLGTNTSGVKTHAGILAAAGIIVYDNEKGGTPDNTDYYDEIAVGDTVTLFVSINRWYEFKITSVETPPAGTHKWGVSFVENDDLDGTGDLPTSSTDNEFRFSRAPTGGTGAVGADGRPGMPGSSFIAQYDDLETSSAPNASGEYAILSDYTSNTSGVNTHAALQAADGILIHDDETGGSPDNTVFYDQIEAGDVIVLYVSSGRWYDYEVVSVESAPANMHKWRVAYLEDDSTDGEDDLPAAGGNNVEIRFSRAPAGISGTAGDSTIITNCYLRKASQPTSPGSGNTVDQYDFTTKTLTAPTTGGGASDTWFVDVPASDGNPCWVCSATWTVSGTTGTDTSTTWGTVSKLMEDGTVGDSIHVATVYLRKGSTPSSPGSGNTSDQYNFTTKVLTPPDIAGGASDNWSATVPTADGNPLYVCSGTFSISGTTGTDTSVTWGAVTKLVEDGIDGSPGAAGDSIHVATVYLRKGSAPSSPGSGNTSDQYNFSTKVLTPPDIAGGASDNWLAAVPAGTDPLYVCSGTFSISGTTGTDTSTTWGSVSKLVEDGTDGSPGGAGDSVHITNCYLRKASQPTSPGSGNTVDQYNFTTKTLTAPTSGGGASDTWFVDVPTADGNPLWVCTGTWSISGTTGTDTTTTWGAVSKLAEDGDDGSPGDSVFVASIYLRKASQPSSPGTGNTVDQYNFTTQTLTAPTIAGGASDDWNVDVPAADGNPCWVCSGTFSVSGTTGTDTTTTWGTVTKLVEDGTDGSPGTGGAGVINVYQRGATEPSHAGLDTSMPYSDGHLGWYINPVAPSNADPLWILTGTIATNGVTISWATNARKVSFDELPSFNSFNVVLKDLQDATGQTLYLQATCRNSDRVRWHVEQTWTTSAPAGSQPSADWGEVDLVSDEYLYNQNLSAANLQDTQSEATDIELGDELTVWIQPIHSGDGLVGYWMPLHIKNSAAVTFVGISFEDATDGTGGAADVVVSVACDRLGDVKVKYVTNTSQTDVSGSSTSSAFAQSSVLNVQNQDTSTTAGGVTTPRYFHYQIVGDDANDELSEWAIERMPIGNDITVTKSSQRLGSFYDEITMSLANPPPGGWLTCYVKFPPSDTDVVMLIGTINSGAGSWNAGTEKWGFVFETKSTLSETDDQTYELRVFDSLGRKIYDQTENVVPV